MMQITRVMTAALLAASLAGGLAGKAQAQTASIVAIVNGQLITSGDVQSRTLLLALSTGMPMTPDVTTRMAPQVTRQLIDQTLQQQEINKRNIVVPETDIVTAVGHIE